MTATPAIEVATETSTTPVIKTRIERPASSFSVITPMALMTSADTRVHSEMKPISEEAMPAGRLQARTPLVWVTPPPARTGIRHPRR